MKVVLRGTLRATLLLAAVAIVIVGILSVTYLQRSDTAKVGVPPAPVSSKETTSSQDITDTLQKVNINIADKETISKDVTLHFDRGNLQEVSYVELHVDGSLVSTSYKYPYDVLLAIANVGPGYHDIQLRGYDAANKLVAESRLVTVRILSQELLASGSRHTVAEKVSGNKLSKKHSKLHKVRPNAGSVKPVPVPTPTPLPDGSAGEPIQAPLPQTPAVPQNLALTLSVETTYHTVLNWSVGAGGVSTTDYVIYRNGHFLANSSDEFHVDTTALPGYTYTYSIYARSEKTRSLYSLFRAL